MSRPQCAKGGERGKRFLLQKTQVFGSISFWFFFSKDVRLQERCVQPLMGKQRQLTTDRKTNKMQPGWNPPPGGF